MLGTSFSGAACFFCADQEVDTISFHRRKCTSEFYRTTRKRSYLWRIISCRSFSAKIVVYSATLPPMSQPWLLTVLMLLSAYFVILWADHRGRITIEPVFFPIGSLNDFVLMEVGQTTEFAIRRFQERQRLLGVYVTSWKFLLSEHREKPKRQDRMLGRIGPKPKFGWQKLCFRLEAKQRSHPLTILIKHL